jgi:hypothetical protein
LLKAPRSRRAGSIPFFLPSGDLIFVNLDIQGAEPPALRGLGGRLANVRWAYLEVNALHMYRDCALIGEIDVFMESVGFARIATRMAGSHGWGDALYVNTRKMPKSALWWLLAKAAAWRVYMR